MRRLLRSLVASLTVLGLALATLGAVPACTKAEAVAAAEAPATHDCDGGTVPADPAHHHDCTMLGASCAPALIAHTTLDVPASSLPAHQVPSAHDESRPGDADRGPVPPPPRA